MEEERLGWSLDLLVRIIEQMAGWRWELLFWFLTLVSPWSSLGREVTWTLYKSRLKQNQPSVSWLIRHQENELWVTLWRICHQQFSWGPCFHQGQSNTSEQVINSKRRSHAESLRQLLENLITSTRGKLKCQTGKNLSFTLMILSKMYYWEGLKCDFWNGVELGECDFFHCLEM